MRPSASARPGIAVAVFVAVMTIGAPLLAAPVEAPVEARENAASPPDPFASLPPAIAETLRTAGKRARLLDNTGSDAARAAAWGRLAMMYHAHRLRRLAEEAYGQAVAAVPEARWYYLRAIVRSEDGAVEASLADFATAAELDPDDGAIHYRHGVALLLGGDVEGAEAAFRRAAKYLGTSAIVLAGLADVALARGDPALARDLLIEARSLEPEAGQLTYKLALAARRLGNAEVARRLLDEIPENRLAPKIDDPKLLNVASMSASERFFELAADWALARADVDSAATALENALDVALERGDAPVTNVLRLTEITLEAGRPERARPALEAFLDQHPATPEVLFALAWVLRLSDDGFDREAAADAARRSHDLEADARTGTLLAAFAMRSRQFEEAANRYETLASAQPDEAYFPYWRAIARLGSGDCAGAADDLKRALAIRPGLGEAHLALARAEALCGLTEMAGARARAVRQARDDADSRLTVAFVARLSGDHATADALASAERPHPDAAMLLEGSPTRAFATESPWWLPPEVRPVHADDGR